MKYFILLFFPFFAFATYVGNPASPHLFDQGLWISNPYVNLRVGYLFDHIYYGKFEEKENRSSNTSEIRFTSQSAIGTINLFRFLDVYGTIGTSKLIIGEISEGQKQTLVASTNFSWSAGGKLILFKTGNFFIGADGKYFQSQQPANFLLLNKALALFIGEFSYWYEEIQGSLAASFTTDFISPYIGVTYLHATMDPSPLKGGVILLSDDLFSDYPGTSFITKRFWGMIVGATVMSSEKFWVNVESRLIDQNAFNVSAAIRF